MRRETPKYRELITLGWSIVRKFLAFRFVLVVLTAAITGIGTYHISTFSNIVDRFEKKLPAFERSRSAWVKATVEVFSSANPRSENPSLPSDADIRRIRDSITGLITSLNTVPTPTNRIEYAADRFKVSLSEVVRELGNYNGSPEATTRIVEFSQTAAQLGETHRIEVEDYLGGTVRQLAGSIL